MEGSAKGAGNLDFLFSHMFLPRKLPGSKDQAPKHESALLAFILDSLRLFNEESPAEHASATQAAISMLESMKATRQHDGRLDERSVQDALERACTHGMSITALLW